jgi:hypothetical protein
VKNLSSPTQAVTTAQKGGAITNTQPFKRFDRTEVHVNIAVFQLGGNFLLPWLHCSFKPLRSRVILLSFARNTSK